MFFISKKWCENRQKKNNNRNECAPDVYTDTLNLIQIHTHEKEKQRWNKNEEVKEAEEEGEEEVTAVYMIHRLCLN